MSEKGIVHFLQIFRDTMLPQITVRDVRIFSYLSSPPQDFWLSLVLLLVLRQVEDKRHNQYAGS